MYDCQYMKDGKWLGGATTADHGGYGWLEDKSEPRRLVCLESFEIRYNGEMPDTGA